MSQKKSLIINSDFPYENNYSISNSPTNDYFLKESTHTYTDEISYVVTNQSTEDMLQQENNHSSTVIQSEEQMPEIILLPVLRMISVYVASIDASTRRGEDSDSLLSFHSDSLDDFEQ